MALVNKRLILGVTGSIAAYKAADLSRRLIEKKFKVAVVMTKEAHKFITPLTFVGLTGKKVYTELFDDDSCGEMPHIKLAQDADILLIAPATANVIGKLAHGLADDLLTCIAMVTPAQILIAPAMNVEMYKNKIVQENCAKLKKIGIKFIEPVDGKLACGMIGQGHIASEDDIIKAVLRAVK